MNTPTNESITFHVELKREGDWVGFEGTCEKVVCMSYDTFVGQGQEWLDTRILPADKDSVVGISVEVDEQPVVQVWTKESGFTSECPEWFPQEDVMAVREY